MQMSGLKSVKKSVSVRRKGIIHFIAFLVLHVALKSGGIYFVFLVVGSYLLDFKTMQTVGVGESIRESAVSAFVFGLILAAISFIGAEILYRRKK